jgi:Domain of unknown function (DUF4440)
MRKAYLAALTGLALLGSAATPAVASASGGRGHDEQRRCARGFHDAVVEDNEAYDSKDPDRYERVLNPRMIFWQDGTTTYGRDAIMAAARPFMAAGGWTWTYAIESETVHGCDSGIAVASAELVVPARNVDAHFVFTMYLVREQGKWTVAADNVHRAS